MRWIRLMTLAGLLVSAGVASAQTAPAPRGEYLPPTAAQFRGDEECEKCPAQTWYYRTLLNAATAWQRLNTICGYAKSDGCCQSAKTCNTAGCIVGVAGCAKGCEMVQAPKSCCCAKECACCEMCKSSKKTVQIERVHVQPMPCPAAGCGVFQVAQPMPMLPPLFVPMNMGAPTVKFVTPDYEILCNHISQRGEVVELTGNVLLLCKKNVQPIRIEAQRILLNLSNGTYTAEATPSATAVTMPVSVGIMRMSIEAVRGHGAPVTGVRTLESGHPAPATFVPASGIIEVIPVPSARPLPR